MMKRNILITFTLKSEYQIWRYMTSLQTQINVYLFFSKNDTYILFMPAFSEALFRVIVYVIKFPPFMFRVFELLNMKTNIVFLPFEVEFRLCVPAHQSCCQSARLSDNSWCLDSAFYPRQHVRGGLRWKYFILVNRIFILYHL